MCPNMRLATTNHAERTNLTMRLFNRRFTRKTINYSKKIENHKFAMTLQVAHFNFCRVHGAIKKTPAMAVGLAERPMTATELLLAA